jgi:hypothetical protein
MTHRIWLIFAENRSSSLAFAVVVLLSGFCFGVIEYHL